MRSSEQYITLKKSVSKYVSKHPSFDKDTNRKLLERLSELKPLLSDPTYEEEYYQIRNNLVLSNGGFAMKYVMIYANILNDSSSISELFQEANIGILESIDTFDINKKNSFTTYAYFHIRKRLIDWIKHSKLVRAPRDIARNMKHVADIQEYIQVNLGIVPTADDIKRELFNVKNINLKIDLIESIMILLMLNSANDGETFISEYIEQTIDDKEMDLFKALEIKLLEDIKDLPFKVKQTLILRYGIGKEAPHSLDEIKLILKLTDQDIKEIEEIINNL